MVRHPPSRVHRVHFQQRQIQASSSNRHVELAGGAYWWMDANKSETVIHGPSFVLQRAGRVSKQGLIPATRNNTAVQPFSHPQKASPPSVIPANQPCGMVLSGVVVIDTEFEEILPASPIPANSSCTGIVYLGTSTTEEELLDDVVASGRHPRRTRRVKFSCNLCGETNFKNVNPQAWSKGSVFCRCEGCSAVHKLKDNLKIFHELRGPVFPPREMRDSFPAVKEILDRIEAKRRQGDVM